MIKAVIVGYGNIGHFVLDALKASPDFEVAGVVRRDATNVPAELKDYKVTSDLSEVKADVAILCTPTRKVEEYAKQALALGMNTVDSFDIHTGIVDLRRSLDAAAKEHGRVAVISAGWDPGSDSVVRTLLEACAPKGITYTNFGPGMSMGHTVAVKAIEGVKAALSMTIPLGTVLTIPATGSEMNNGAVISRRETHEKYPFYADYPVFSILDPTVTFSLPDFQIACGLADTFVHVMEQYMTKSNESYLMDRWSESFLRTLVQIAPLIKENKQDYHLMSEFMMSATMALNGFIAMGVSQDWATHMIGHELTALHGMTHGQTLAIVFPGTLRTLADKKRDKILQYGERIWGVTSGVPSARIALTIDKTEEFFKSLGLKTRLGEAGIGDDTIEEIARRFDERGAAFGEDGDVTGEVARRILQNCK